MFVVVLLLCAIAMIGCQKKPANEPSENAGTEKVEKETKIQLLSFDSYDEIAGTRISLGYQLGRLSINKDKAYITEGVGSMKVEPQGDYGRPNEAPYVQFDCVESTFRTNDFLNFRNVSFDVYNDTDKELHIAMSVVAESISNTVSFPSVTYTLEPNAWTKCVFQIEGNMPDGYSYLEFIRFVTLTFPEFKTAKDDVVNELYIDNLVAECYETPLNVTDKGYDFYEGVTFEDSKQQCLVVGNTGIRNRVEFTRVSYEEIGMKAPTDLGTYGMKGKVTDQAVWPTFTFNFGEVIPKGSVLTFWTYIGVDDVTPSGGSLPITSGKNTIYALEKDYNHWFEMAVVLSEDSESVSVQLNLDDNWYDATGNSFFVDQELNIYVDNAKILKSDEWTAPEEIQVAADGTITIYNPTGDSGRKYWVEKPMKAGQKLTFDIDFNSSEKVTVWVLVNGKWNQWTDGVLTEQNEMCANVYPTWTGKRTITCIANKDMDNFAIYLKYEGPGVARRICTISNLKITTVKAFDVLDFEDAEQMDNLNSNFPISRVTYESVNITASDAYGKHALFIDSKEHLYPSVDIMLGRSLKEDMILTYKVYVEADEATIQKNQFIAEVSGKWARSDLKFNRWETVTRTLPTGTTTMRVMLNFKWLSSLAEGASVKVYVDNITIAAPEPEKVIEPFEVLDFETDKQMNNVSSSYIASRVSYESRNIVAEESLGKYGLRIDTEGKLYPMADIDLGKTLDKDMILTFDVYAEVDATKIITDKFIAEVSGKWASSVVKFNQWQTITYRVVEGTSSVRLMMNFAYMQSLNNGTLANVYIDNVRFTEPEPEKVIEPFETLDFEVEKQLDNVVSNLAYARKAYADLAVDLGADASKGTYVLQVNSAGNKYPAIEIELGKTYSQDMNFMFDVYVETDSANITSDRFIAEVAGKWARSDLKFNKWEKVTATVLAGSSKARIMINLAWFNSVASAEGVNVYIDNITIAEPEPEITIEPFDVLNFENASHIHNISSAYDFTRFAYAELTTNLGVDASFGEYGLSIHSGGLKYPVLDIDLGKTYSQALKVNFKIYVQADESQISNNQFIVEVAGKWARSNMKFNQWEDVTAEIPAGSSSMRIMLNLSQCNSLTAGASVIGYIDNISIEEEKELASLEKLDFESALDAEYVTVNNQVASLNRVAYVDTDVTADSSTYGNYALQAVPSKKWPVFTINLGKAYDTDVTITFSTYLALDAAYINQDYVYVDQGGTNPGYGRFNTWNTFTATIPAGSTEYSFRFNFDLGNRVSDVTKMVIYLDNFNIDG